MTRVCELIYSRSHDLMSIKTLSFYFRACYFSDVMVVDGYLDII
jgi:hypothetical protein